MLDNLAGQFCTSAISGQPNTNTSPDWTITHVDIFGAGFCSSTVCKEGVDFTLTVDQRYVTWKTAAPGKPTIYVTWELRETSEPETP